MLEDSTITIYFLNIIILLGLAMIAYLIKGIYNTQSQIKAQTHEMGQDIKEVCEKVHENQRMLIAMRMESNPITPPK